MILSLLRARPKLSVVVVVYRMPEQASRTLLSLAPSYQRDVTESEYEIIVVENDSGSLLGAGRAALAAANVRYFHRNETQPTPVNAVNFGAAQARGDHVAIIVDGARMLTPGVIRLSLDAMCMDPRGAVAVPGYHLGHRPQQEAVDHGYDATEEAELLTGIHWPSDGYRLFDIAVLSTSARDGFVLPSPESNFLAMSRETWRAVGGMNTRYDSHGGGYANHDLYKRVLERPGTRCYFLFGEGCFHQYHGGVTTGTPGAEREWIYESILEQDIRIRGDDRAPPQNAPVFFGSLHPAAYRFLTYSIEQAAAAQNTRQPQREK